MTNHAIILLADDEADDVLLMKRALTEAGLVNPVHVVSDGLEAMEYLKSAVEAKISGYCMPLLICLDLKMPGRDGFQVLHWIRQQKSLRDIPVVIVSQSDDELDVDRAAQLGANSYLVKPTDYKALVNRMEDIRQILGTVEVVA